MSSESSIDMDDDMDVEEGALIKTVQSSIFEIKNPSVMQEPVQSPIEKPQKIEEKPAVILSGEISPKSSDKKQLLELSISEISSVSENKRENFVSSSYKNFLQKNIDLTKKKKADINIEGIEIDELLLEEDEKRAPINVDERFYKYQDKVKEKIQTLAKELKEKEMEKCTFKPEVKSQTQKRTTDQFINQMINYEKVKKDKIEALRSQKKDAFEDDAIHHPVINQKSKDIIAKKGEPSQPIYEKLYKSATKEKVAEKSPPKQSVSKASSTRRAEPIEKILYEDALRRANKPIELKIEKKESQVSNKSQQVLAKKFIKEFSEIISVVEGIEGDKISQEAALKVLVCLNFIRNNPEHPKFEEEKALVDKFFKIIKADSIKTQNMLKLSLAILNIYIPTMTINFESEPPSQQGPIVDGHLSISKEEVLKYHKQFIVFFDNRQLSNQIIKQNAAEEFPFKPKLNSETKAIAKEVQKRAGSLCSQKREEFLQEEKKKTQEKIERLRKEKEEQEAKSCTFKPVLLAKSYSKAEVSDKDRGLALFERSKEIQEKKQLKMKEVNNIEIEKNMSECTFAPRLEKIKVKEDKEILNSKSVQQQLMRMQKAREEQERKKNILERPTSGKKLSFGIDYSHKSKSSFKPPLPQGRTKSPLKGTSYPDDGLYVMQDYRDANEYQIGDEGIENLYKEKPPEVIPKSATEENDDDEEIQLVVKMPNGSHKTLIIPPGADKELKLSIFILENKINEDLARKLRSSVLNM